MATLRMKIVVLVTLISISGDALYVAAAESSKSLAFLPSILLLLSDNVANKSCEDNWTIIGDIPEYSFSSEPLIDENTAFTMNVDPADQLMLTAVTSNGWTVEYFAVKDNMGAPVVLTGIHAKKDDTDEYLEIKTDGENRPISIEQQDGNLLVMNWDNCTIYGKKDWLVLGELPDFSSIPLPDINDQAEFVSNTAPSDPLWLTVTTDNGWTIKYFGTKNAEGYLTGMTFVYAENNASGDVVKVVFDESGQPVELSINDGKIVNLDWKLFTISVGDGTLSYHERNYMNAMSSSDTVAADCERTSKVPRKCLILEAFNPIKPLRLLGALLAGECNYVTRTAVDITCFPDDPPKSQATRQGLNLLYSYVSAAMIFSGPVGFVAGALTLFIIEDFGDDIASHPWFGSSSGDPHIFTFGRSKYDFQAVGEFILLQSTVNPAEMSIQIRQGSWISSNHIAGNKVVAMSVAGDLVVFNVASNPRLFINNAPVTMADKEVRQLSNGCKIYAANQWRYWVIWKDNSMAEVKMYNKHLDISVSLPDSRKGLVKGLLGNIDDDKTNDLQTRDGSTTFDISTELTKDELYNQFGNSWRITQEESLFTYAEGEDTATYTDLNFPYELVKADDLSATVRTNAEQTCRDAGITDPILLQDCILDVGVTGDATFADNMTDLTPPEQSITVTDGWLLYEDAQKAEGDKVIRITPDAAWQTGMALREGALNLDGSFEKTFTIYMGDSDNGADGMVFAMFPELPPEGTSLNGGEGLGFSSACNNKPCFGVEIDTYRNTSDPMEDHIALIQNSSVRHSSTENQALPLVPLSFNIEDDAEHSLTVGWNKDTQTFSVSLDGTTVITHEGLDLKTLLGTSTASYGFVGATGSMTSEQYFYPVISL
ncbi:lectin-like domain-containing protein [Candidatus Electrothrix sp.]|uniref:lectin-like domain-containing protein n=1 Tax=Candidatus Electrothrix sp. TaxID=2170559 RepID=UPI004057C21C